MRGEWLNLAFALIVFGLIVQIIWGRHRRKTRAQPAPDGPPDESYRLFTTEYDLELRANELDRLISASPDYSRGWFKPRKVAWEREIGLVDELAASHRERFLEVIGQSPAFRDSAFTFLIDQSGSMEGDPMRWASVSCILAAETLSELGAKVEILGFSTAGWRGGFAYQKWQASGRPKRPGRLAALLHVIYKDFADGTFDRPSWEAMLDPNILRENVDGEALEWAAARLRRIPAKKRNLIVLSDGAPVDDATMMHNGPNYLVRHLAKVISNLESSDDLRVSAIGLGHEVRDYYSRSTVVTDLTQLPEAVAGSLRNLTGMVSE